MKKCIIITPFFNYSYDVRIKTVEKVFVDNGYSVIIITSNFDHRSKKKYFINKDNVRQIDTMPYTKNLSFGRIKSHIMFAKDSIKAAIHYRPDIIYVSGPPNSLFRYSKKIKKECAARILFELGDMWPETLPSKGFLSKLGYPMLLIWKYYRNRYLCIADKVIFECDLFRNHLLKFTKNGETVYLSKSDGCPTFNTTDFIFECEILNFLYIGSLNNIIDYDLIVSFLKEIEKYKKTKLFIIGDGEKKDYFLSMLVKNGLDFSYEGLVFDDEKKYLIARKCQFAFNIMKDSVLVGATMKSLDYFNFGVALINNIKGDTTSIIESYCCGYNIFDFSSITTIAKTVAHLSIQDIISMRIQSRDVFLKYFNDTITATKISSFIKEMENNHEA